MAEITLWINFSGNLDSIRGCNVLIGRRDSKNNGIWLQKRTTPHSHYVKKLHFLPICTSDVHIWLKTSFLQTRVWKTDKSQMSMLHIGKCNWQDPPNSRKTSMNRNLQRQLPSQCKIEPCFLSPPQCCPIAPLQTQVCKIQKAYITTTST